MDFLQSIGGKIVTGLVALAVIAAGVSWYQMDPGTRHAIASDTGRILAWFGIVLFLPWVTFFLVSAVARQDSNLAGLMLVGGYTVVEAVVLAWLFAWSVHGAMPLVFFSGAVLLASAYNLLACDWIAEKLC
jgi:FtsH-binding integral membrane protein